MITRNFKNFMASVLGYANVTKYAGAPLVDISGLTWYVSSRYGNVFPGSNAKIAQTNPLYRGIIVGSSDAEASEDDYELKAPIASGISLSIASMAPTVDGEGNPYIEIVLTVTNTGSASVTVAEVGYREEVACYALPIEGSIDPNAVNRVIMFDRTVLDSPLTLASQGDAGTITYNLKTVVNPPKIVNGVKIVSWSYGADEDVAAMIDAAQQGIIDLQTDGGWRVGDVRLISLDAFSCTTASGDFSNPAQDFAITITNFGDYNSSGSVMQFDFISVTANAYSLAQQASVTNCYKNSYAYTTILPAMAEAMPSWIRTRLVNFNVLAIDKPLSQSSVAIETVPNNKLALRSVAEVAPSSASGLMLNEGTPLDYYAPGALCTKKYAALVYTRVANYANTWPLRSPTGQNDWLSISNVGNVGGTGPASASFFFAPFGCL